jgi:hypothetical protein
MNESIATLAYDLLRRITDLRNHPDAGAAVRDITAAVHHAQAAIDRPPSRIYAGPCPNCHADLIGKPGQPSITCRQCGRPYDVAERHAALRIQLDDHLDTPPRLAHVITALGYPVTPELIRKWASRGKLAARPGGMYRAGDVITLAMASHLRT